MRLQDLSLADKSWYLMLTLPGATLRGKVTTNMSTGDLVWSDDSARQWFEAELAKRHGQVPPPPAPLPVSQSAAEAALKKRLEEIEKSSFLSPEEKERFKAQVLRDFYGTEAPR